MKARFSQPRGALDDRLRPKLTALESAFKLTVIKSARYRPLNDIYVEDRAHVCNVSICLALAAMATRSCVLAG